MAYVSAATILNDIDPTDRVTPELNESRDSVAIIVYTSRKVCSTPSEAHTVRYEMPKNAKPSSITGVGMRCVQQPRVKENSGPCADGDVDRRRVRDIRNPFAVRPHAFPRRVDEQTLVRQR